MKAIMISIQPQWVEKILNGEKTIEIRKTKPSCELPCKVYIYCTMGKNTITYIERKGEKDWFCNIAKQTLIVTRPKYDYMNYTNETLGKVVAEFTLNKIDKFDSAYSEWAYSVAPEGSEMPISETQFIQMAEQKGKLDCNDLLKYFGDEDYIAYMWHIDNLKIYDKPKELSEFYIETIDDDCCVGCPYHETPIGEEPCKNCYGNRKYITRPPQSWCYVEELENE